MCRHYKGSYKRVRLFVCLLVRLLVCLFGELHCLLRTTACWQKATYFASFRKCNFKATVRFRQDWLGLPCLMQRTTIIFGILKDYSHKINIFASNFEDKMLSSKLCTNVQKLKTYRSYDFVQISPACIVQILTPSNVSMVKHKLPDRKINFGLNLPLKFFPATIANVDNGSFKSLGLHTLFDTHLDHVLVKCWYINRMGRNINQNFEFLTKTGFF